MFWKLFFPAVLIGTILIATSASFSDDTEPAGQKLFVEKKCTTCHSIESQGITLKKQTKAPDLSDVGSRHNADFIKKFITKQEKLNDKSHMIAFKGSDEELNRLAAWLESLKAVAPEDSTKQ